MLAHLSLGSNLSTPSGDPAATLAAAVGRLGALPRSSVRRVSHTYRTVPMGFREQPDFANLVAEVETPLEAPALLAFTTALELAFERRREVFQGPRSLDIDLLLLGDLILDEAGIVVPHPRLHQRRFVLVPLAELASELIHPILKRSVAALLAEAPATPYDVVRWESVPSPSTS